MFQGKTILLGVTGSIAAYKTAALASALVKRRACVHVMMTPNACHFINPITFETLTGNKCLVDTFDRNFTFAVEHVSIAKQADLCLVAPASANVCGKLANGIADDMLTTTVMACRCKKLIAPAMNTAMFENTAMQRNLAILSHDGWEVIDPAVGYLACGDTGRGKMPEPEVLMGYIERELAKKKDMDGLKLLVTAGPTREALDPVRYITNHSSGKMGIAIAKAAMLRGADVTLVCGPVSVALPPFVNVVDIISAADMFDAVVKKAPEQDIIIKAAAVADFTPAEVAHDKIKKKEGELTLSLTKTKDILAYLGEHKRPGQFLCGFSMETRDMVENSREKLRRKNLDLIAANNVKVPGAGFQGDTNILTLITREDECALPLMSKEEAADILLNKIMTLRKEGR